MSPDPYGTMELLRLSPSTGKALRRLNVIQGQVLHGRVYKMEPYAPSSVTGTDMGGVAKIALGSHIIDANVAKSIPEGSKVILEVVRMADESFILRLLAVEEPGTSSSGANSQPDTAVISSVARENASQPLPVQTENPVQPAFGEFSSTDLISRLVELPDWSDLPSPVAHILRSAVNLGFINPTGFTTQGFSIRGAFNQAIIELQADLGQFSASIPTDAKPLAESIESLLGTIRTMIPNLPGGDIEIGESSTPVITALKEYAAVLKALVLPAVTSGTPAQARTDAAFTPSTEPAGHAPQAVIEGGIPSPDGKSIAAFSTDAMTTEPPGTQPAQPPSSMQPQVPGQEPLPVPGLPAAENVPVADLKQMSGTAETPPIQGSREQVAASTDGQSQGSDVHSSRNLLFGLRTLVALIERFTQVKGLPIETASTFSNHALQLTALADALEGSLIAPLLSRVIDIPNMVPRLIINMLFSGGNAELAILQPDGSHSDSGTGEGATGDTDEDRCCTGVIRLNTSGLGKIGVRVDYRENDGQSRVEGFFAISSEIADDIRASLPSLERSLDARGIDTGLIRVRSINRNAGNEENSGGNDKPVNREFGGWGGLDIKI